jgi:serine/threonine protein phosphatase PrpC
MEDAKVFKELEENVYLFGIFDGHGGSEVACYVSKIIAQELVK